MMSKNRLNPWAGLASYEDPEFAEHKLKFCGRDAETYDVARLIHNNVFVTLYGKSGIGKSSLLNAGVFPELREDGYIPLSIRLGIRDYESRLSFQTVIINAIEQAVKAEIVDVIPEQDDDQSSDFLWSYFARHIFYNKYDEQIVPVIVLDQFEEVLINDREDTQVLLRQLDYLNDKDHRLDNCEVDGRSYSYELNYRFVVSIREDDLYRLEDSLDNCYLPALKRCRYRLRSLTEEGARDVVLIPGEGLLRPEDQENIVRKVLDIARVKEDNTISTNLLSLVCNRVFNEFKKSGADHITIPFVESFMKGNPIESFYNEATAGFSESEKEYIETHFIDCTGRRNSVSEADFLSKVPKGRKLLDGDSRILQRLSSGSDAKNGRMELIHDSFCEPIALQKEKREKKKRSRQLALLGSALALCVLVIAFVIFLIHNAKQANWKMMENKARFVAEKGQQLIDENDSYLARLLALEILPKDIDNPKDKPYVPEAEALLRRTYGEGSAVLKGQSPLNSVSFSPDGRYIVSGSRDNTIRLWDVSTGVEVCPPFEGHTDDVESVSFSPDGRYILSGSSDNTIRLWDVSTGVEVCPPFGGHTGRVMSVSFSPDGRYIVSGSWDNTIRLWDVSTGVEVCPPFEGHTHYVESVSFSPDGRYIVSGSLDETIRLWDVSTGVEVCPPFEGHTDDVESVSFSPDGRYIVSGSLDKTIRLWDVSTGVEVCPPFEGHTLDVTSVSFSSDGRYILSGSRDNTIRLWDLSTGVEVCPPFEGHTFGVASVSFSPDGRYIVSGSFDKTIRLWDVSTGVEVCPPFEGHTDCVMSVSFSPDGRYIVSGSFDKTIRLWDVSTGVEVCPPFEGNTDFVLYVSFSPDGRYIVSSSFDNTIRLWDVSTGVEVCPPFEGYTVGVTPVSFSPDGRYIVSCPWDNTIRLWDVSTGVEVCPPFEGHTDSVMSISFSPDGRYIVSGSFDKTIRLWDVSTGVEVCPPFEGHTDGVMSVSFSPDGRYILSGSSDRTIRLWDVSTGVEVCPPFEGHTDDVESVSFSPDGRYIVSGSLDKTIRLWYFPPLQELIDQTRERFKNRQLTPEERKIFYLD